MGRAGDAGRAGTLERTREVFRSRGFRRFFAARMVSQVGDGLFQIAAAEALLFSDRTGNPALRLLAISSLTLIPFSAIGPFTGVFIDRWERRKILVRVPLVRAVAAALTPLAATLFGMRGIAFWTLVILVLSANRFFLATMNAVLPQLVPADDLLVANSAATTGGSIANVVGLGAGSALVGWVGGQWAGIFVAFAFAFAALAARRVPVRRGHEHENAPLWDEVLGVLRELREGARRMRRSPRVRYAMSAVALVQVLVGVMTAVLVFFYIRVLDKEVDAAFALLGVLAAGIGLGVVLVPVVARFVRHDVLVPVAFLIASAGSVYGGIHLTEFRMVSGTALIGMSYAFTKIPVDTIVQEEMADAVRGRAFAIYDMLFNVARVAGLALGAIAYERHATSAGLVQSIGLAYLVAAAMFFIWERRQHALRP